MYDFQGMNSRLQSFRQIEPSEGHQVRCLSWAPSAQAKVIKPKLARPGRVPVTSCAWDRDGKHIAGGIGDGSIQIFATSGDKKEGETHILYDPAQSERGACVCVARAPRKKSIDDYQPEPVIHNPHALPLFRDPPSRKRQREKALKDPATAHKPELPMTGPGHGGRVGTTGSGLLTQFLLKQEDPREAILKFADVAVKDPKFIAPAYSETQPKAIFAKSDDEEEEDDVKK